MTALGEFRGTLGASCAPCNGLKSVYDDDGGGGADDHNEIFLCAILPLLGDFSHFKKV